MPAPAHRWSAGAVSLAIICRADRNELIPKVQIEETNRK